MLCHRLYHKLTGVRVQLFRPQRIRSSLNLIRSGFHKDTNAEYTKAVKRLNTWHPDANIKDGECLKLMSELISRVGVTQDDLKKLNIIHVSGTKGKGSTCAFVESILRHNGFRTGLYTSPHLVEVRERIKLNGKALSRNQFAKYFNQVYDKLDSTKQDFKVEFLYPYFLTVLAFHVFKHADIDVLVLEVGLGGSYDCTNIVEHPIVCGISALGMDHTSVLGNAITSIAWHKAGIMKPNVPAFTSRQKEGAIQVLHSRANEKKAPLYVIPDFSQYTTPGRGTVKLGLAGEHQKANASLALQLTQYYMNTIAGKSIPPGPFALTETQVNGLQNCVWKGRAQIMKFNGITFYLDAAHTINSMKCCSEWFEKESALEEKQLNRPCTRVLIFNVTKQRNSTAMFQELVNCDLTTHAIFVPNIATLRESSSADQEFLIHPMEEQLHQVVENHKIWLTLKQEQLAKKNCLRTQQKWANSSGYDITTDFESLDNDEIISKTTAFSSIANAILWLSENRDEKLTSLSSEYYTPEASNYTPDINPMHHLQILVTGSVHLIGGFLRIIDPNIND